MVVIQGRTDSGEVLGSGFIVSKDGKIVTNLHVIRDMNTADVQTATGHVFHSLTVLAIDESKDLAIIQVPGADLPSLEMGNSNTVSVGEQVVIVGSPQGLGGTVTAGILSSVRDSGEGFTVLQTDAAVNPGNSGGPLVNSSGQAIGVVAFKLNSSEGLNFAIPINYVYRLFNTIHEPMTLDQMRDGLFERASRRINGLSLRETLDWLKAAIPLSIFQYSVARSVQGSTDTTETAAPISFQSCTIIYDLIVTSVLKDYSGLQVTYSTRFTIPLGQLNKDRVATLPNDDNITYKVTPWLVALYSPTQGILSEDHDDLGHTKKKTMLDLAFLNFNDATLANRVQQAFNHAMDLCRGKERSMRN